jgi:hypothetical protein
MKRSNTILTLLLPAFCAATAAAQFAPVRLLAPVNPVAGLPKVLPSPITGPLAGTGISLPTPVPSLTPSVVMAQAVVPTVVPAPAAPAIETPMSVLPDFLPHHGGTFPELHTGPSQVVVTPLDEVQAGAMIRFAGAAAESSADGSKKKLDETFDGEGRPSKPAVEPRRAPVSSGRHISLPERDLERELGI